MDVKTFEKESDFERIKREWQKCEFEQYLQENFGLTLEEYDDIEQTSFERKLNMEWYKWHIEECIENFLEKLRYGCPVATKLNERFNLSDLTVDEILESDEILDELESYSPYLQLF